MISSRVGEERAAAATGTHEWKGILVVCLLVFGDEEVDAGGHGEEEAEIEEDEGFRVVLLFVDVRWG